MTDRHKEFAEAMRNIIRHNEEKEKKQRNVDNDFDEEDFLKHYREKMAMRA